MITCELNKERYKAATKAIAMAESLLEFGLISHSVYNDLVEPALILQAKIEFEEENKAKVFKANNR